MDEIRYMKRDNLHEESKIIGNYYSDIINQYGIDCNYYKINIPYMEIFKSIIDNNTMILHAYGQETHPDYHISTDMVTFCEMESDLLELNKYGIIPNVDVNFYFDSTNFATQLAYELGQLKEYKIKEKEIIVENIPELTGRMRFRFDDPIDFESVDKIGQTVLSGKFIADIPYWEYDTEYSVPCKVIEHGDMKIEFPTNWAIYKSFKYRLATKKFLDNFIMLKYHIERDEERGINVLHGTIEGATLFRDLNKVGKYLELIHPDVGDVITIDFPDSKSRQQYEITDCYDKRLTTDGINPLLHKYVWKCKAKRRIDAGEDIPEINEDNERMEEKIDMLNNVDEIIADKISKYDDDASDAAYGGYERELESHDKRKVDYEKDEKLDFIDDGSYIELIHFKDDSRLLTDGYELFFVTKDVDGSDKYVQLTLVEDVHTIDCNLVASGIQYLKSSNNALYFVNFDNRVQKLCEDRRITKGEVEICLNSFVDTTYDIKDNNHSRDMFYKFRESDTVLMSINGNLYCRFGNKKHNVVKLA